MDSYNFSYVPVSQGVLGGAYSEQDYDAYQTGFDEGDPSGVTGATANYSQYSGQAQNSNSAGSIMSPQQAGGNASQAASGAASQLLNQLRAASGLGPSYNPNTGGYTGAPSTMAGIPMWVWLLGLGLFLALRKRHK